MQTRKFVRTGMETTPVGFANWAVEGSDRTAGWGPQDDQESVGAIGETSISLGQGS